MPNQFTPLLERFNSKISPEDAADAQIDAALAKLDETIERLSDLAAQNTPDYEERD